MVWGVVKVRSTSKFDQKMRLRAEVTNLPLASFGGRESRWGFVFLRFWNLTLMRVDFFLGGPFWTHTLRRTWFPRKLNPSIATPTLASMLTVEWLQPIGM
jgi:hypothetical protein